MSLAPLLLFFFFIYWMSGRMGSGMSNMGGGIFNVGKSKAKMYEKGNAIGITFKDVAGQEGLKAGGAGNCGFPEESAEIHRPGW